MDQENSQNDQPQPAATPEHNTLMAILAYVSILVLIPLLAAKDDPFVKFHVKQGLVLLIIEVAASVLASVLWVLGILWTLIDLAMLVYSIIGIVNAAEGKQKELPFIGGFAKSIKF